MAPRMLKLCYSALLLSSIVYLVLYSTHYIPLHRSAPWKSTTSSNKTALTGDATPAPIYSSAESQETKVHSVNEQVTNSTLGFQKILVINLPERDDRRYLLSSMAKHQGVELEWMDAVRGEYIPKASWPKSWKGSAEHNALTMGEIGNWKSHRNVLQRVVDSAYTSALILEDDADWDVVLKSQLKDFAHATRNIENRQRAVDNQIEPNNRTLTPYGSTWDILWLGICANPPAPEDAEIFPGIGGEQHFVYPVRGGTACTYAYGVTQSSARSLLVYLEDIEVPTDIAMSAFCASRDKGCLVVWPMLISSHKAAGSSSRDSDIGHNAMAKDSSGATVASEEEIREKGWTWKIAHSAIIDTLEMSGAEQLIGN